MNRGSTFFYLSILGAWLLMAAWQGLEHRRVMDSAEAALLNRAHDISHSISAVVRVGRPGVVRLDRLQDALGELARSEDLISVALLNAIGDVVARAGIDDPVSLDDLPPGGMRFNTESVTIVNLVDFGPPGMADDATTLPTTIYYDPEQLERYWPPPRRRQPDDAERIRRDDSATTPGGASSRHRDERLGTGRGPGPRFGEGYPPFRRPSWISPERYEELLLKQGLHGFVIDLSRGGFDREIARDRALRMAVLLAAAAALGGAALARTQIRRSSRLQLRLVRASQLNMHLREMNLAAAGLAHETRNPLNLIRVLAQSISGQGAADTQIRDRAGEITGEVDRVTARLNEFITYSRPPEPQPVALDLAAVVREVERALEVDLREKEATLELIGDRFGVLADEALLRQVLFNLMLNAVQSIDRGGRIEVELIPAGGGEVALEVRDDGPGVAPDQREEIFRPYFTTREGGSGLGLSVVRQIALAHHWEVECLDPGPAGGARFRVGGLRG